MTMCFGNYDDDDEVVKFASEMTLRDYFAGKALTGLLAESNNEYFDDNIVLRKMSYFNLWFRPLIEISIFIFITIIILSWSKYFKKELAKYGLTSKEYNRLRKENKLDDYLKNYENE